MRSSASSPLYSVAWRDSSVSEMRRERSSESRPSNSGNRISSRVNKVVVCSAVGVWERVFAIDSRQAHNAL